MIKQFFIISFSVLLLAASINLFLAPHHIAAGGVSGIGILVEYAFGINIATTVMVLNVFMLVLAFIFLGRAVFTKILVGSLLFPLALAIIPEYMSTTDKTVSILFGSALFGIGVAILYRNNASSGGTTIPPLIAKKYFGLNTSIGLLVTDSIVVFFNIIVFGRDSFFFAILSLIVTSIVMNYIEIGTNRKRILMVNSAEHIDDISDKMLAEGHRKVRSFYSHNSLKKNDEKTLILLLDNSEYQPAISFIEEIDPNALIIAYNVAEVRGLETL